MVLFLRKYAPMKNIANKLTNINWKLKKLAMGVLYRISANNPQNNISYALKYAKNAITTITVNHHGKNRMLENKRRFKIILK
tara:strand:- start:187 stop:432 length:246 start_codon:yes stop_codon:yes gene_type:complete